jgi:hypothetical protein
MPRAQTALPGLVGCGNTHSRAYSWTDELVSGLAQRLWRWQSATSNTIDVTPIRRFGKPRAMSVGASERLAQLKPRPLDFVTAIYKVCSLCRIVETSIPEPRGLKPTCL